jgi:hypothetical protein
MAKQATVDETKPDDRVDEWALGMFAAMGYNGRLPDALVKVYNDVKTRKDKITPGRLSAEGFACVAVMSSILTDRAEQESK